MTDHLATDVMLPSAISWNDMGWGEAEQTELERYRSEQVIYEKAVNAQPRAFMQRAERPIDSAFKQKWDTFQRSKGYEEGSCDLTLIGEFYYGTRYKWRPQSTGSCTISNAFRMWSRRALWEVLAKGQLENVLGTTEYGKTSASFYAPLSYGIARQIGGLRRGDGGFCGSTIESLMLGVIDCDHPELHKVLRQLGADSDDDLPEPRSDSVYRQFQNWTYNDRLKPFLTSPLLESVKVTSTAQLDDNLRQYKPSLCCSMLAVKKGGEYNGLTYFVINPNDTWAHNMSWGGKIVWNGRTFYLLSNESWPGAPIYPIPADEVDRIFSKFRPDVMTMGEIGLDHTIIEA